MAFDTNSGAPAKFNRRRLLSAAPAVRVIGEAS